MHGLPSAAGREPYNTLIHQGVQQQRANDFCCQYCSPEYGAWSVFGREQTVNETNNGSGDGKTGKLRRNGTVAPMKSPNAPHCKNWPSLGPRYNAAIRREQRQSRLMFHAAMDKNRIKSRSVPAACNNDDQLLGGEFSVFGHKNLLISNQTTYKTTVFQKTTENRSM